MKILDLTLKGQIRGGKNNYLVTKQGRHIPNKRFTAWRDYAVIEIVNQLPSRWRPIERADLIWLFAYTPEDNRRRDITAILDALFHAFERAGVVKDDSLIRHIFFTTLNPDKCNANLRLQIYEDKDITQNLLDLFILF